MSLNFKQKDYIKKNIRRLTIEQIAGDLSISSADIHKFLKKRWRKDKYQKFINSQKTGVRAARENDSFEFSRFFHGNRLIFGILFGLVIIVYFNSLFGGFVSDDISAIANNPNIGNFSNVFSNSIFGSISIFFHFLAFKLGGGQPFLFHLISLLFHLATTFAIFTLMSLLAKKPVAVITAGIFAVHPLLSESVNWISALPYSAYGFFMLLAFIFYILAKNESKFHYYSLGAFLIALAASERAMMLVGIIIVYELVFGDFKHKWKKIIPFASLGLFWFILIFGRIGQRMSDLDTNFYQSGERLNPFVQIPVAISSYLKLIFWPQSLSLYQTEMGFSTGRFLLYLLGFLLFATILVVSYFKNRKIFFWLSFFVIVLLPTLTPLGISWIVAERYAYIASVGIFAALAYLISFFLENEKNRKIVYAVLGIILVALSVRTIVRNHDWKNEDNLWIATAKTSPSGPVIHNNLGDVYSRQGNLDLAEQEFKKAIEINPDYADAIHNLGNLYREKGEYEKALGEFNKALEINPNIWQSYQNIAAIYFEQENYQAALENIQKALEINPENKNLKQNLAVIESKL